MVIFLQCYSVCSIYSFTSYIFSLQDYPVHVTDEFLEFISDGALAIEVWGHRCAGNGRSLWELDALEAKTQTLRDRYVFLLLKAAPFEKKKLKNDVCFARWSEVSRRIELCISIQELNEQGDYSSVELLSAKDSGTGGVFQLRQVRKKPMRKFLL